MPAKVLREFEKCDVLFAHSVLNADDAVGGIGEANDLTAGPSELALDGLHAVGW
jgi:hypothetical protein